MSALAEPLDVMTLAEALRPALLKVSRRLRQESAKAGVSAQDALLIGHILRHPGIGVSGLAEAEQTSKPTMSSHVKRLEAAGWISRRGDAADGRRSGLEVTPAGLRQVEAVRRRRNDWLAARLKKLSPAERERLAAAAEPLLRLMSLEP
ncbi:MAG: MarR family transcriptional regulator [Phenylobacterium sp.]|nr:MAG: MarR family transcriptional regulator [Phenylobacterium sp.]